MARRVGAVALVIGAVVFAVRVPSGLPLVDTFVFALGVMVALVPEGLPATLSVSLAIGVRRMARGTPWLSGCWRSRRWGPRPSSARTRPAL